jgi:uncharacterized protein (DUF2141 family)
MHIPVALHKKIMGILYTAEFEVGHHVYTPQLDPSSESGQTAFVYPLQPYSPHQGWIDRKIYSTRAGQSSRFSTRRRADLELTVTQRTGKAIIRVHAWQKAAVRVLVCVAMLLPIPQAHAQTQNGINGTVTDSSQAVVAGANVTITNRATGVVSQAVTSSAGTFTVIGLIPGDYAVAADAPGFRKVETTVVVEVARISNVKLTLTPGATSETVKVEGSLITLDTTSPEVGTTLEPEMVSAAPIEINGLSRQIDSFSYLAPGVQGSANFHNINGGVTYENESQFNGVPVAFVQFQGNQSNINPPYEAVNEFRVSSST